MKRTIAIVSLSLAFLYPATAAAKTWYIKADKSGDAPTIQAGVDSANHGDTLLVAAGHYSWSNQATADEHGLIHILRGSADMTIRSESGPRVTTIDGEFQGRIVFFQGETELTIEGFTFTQGVAPSLGNFTGGAFAAHLSSPIVRNCIFTNNSADQQGGAYWYGGVGAPQIIDCTFVDNRSRFGGAIFVLNSSLTTTISNCTIRNNTATEDGGGVFGFNIMIHMENTTLIGNTASVVGGGFYVQSNHPSTVSNCTFYENEADVGGGIGAVEGDLTVDRVIVAKSLGGAAVDFDAVSNVTFSCSNFYGNNGGDWTGPVASQSDQNGNFSADAAFCGTSGSFNFLLQEASPCAEGNHPNGDGCGLIGAHPVGCKTPSVHYRTWGAVKSLYVSSP